MTSSNAALESLLRHLRESGFLRMSRVHSAFRTVDRRFFVPKELLDEAYGDYPLSIGYGATISQPTTVAFMLETLDVQPGQKALDIGSGSGWTTALLAYLVGPKGKVMGLEIVPELVETSQANIKNLYSVILENNRTRIAPMPEIRQARREVVGLPEEAPYDRILVSAAARRVPKELIGQLKPDGVMIIPVGEEGKVQRIVRVHRKLDGEVETEEYPGFAFVPLR